MKYHDLIQYLRGLAHGDFKFDNETGICGLVNFEFGYIKMCLVIDLMGEWPERSDSSSYPVPHPTESSAWAYQITENLWDRRTTYGKARCRLALWLADELEKLG